MTLTIPHGDLQDGDQNWREGFLFRVSELRRYSACPECAGVDGAHYVSCPVQANPKPPRELIRFTGHVVNRASSIAGTCYDGGRYGAWGDYPAVIEPRE